ncbi:phosphatidate cytidylyltransferase [Rhodovulum imhoffii]
MAQKWDDLAKRTLSALAMAAVGVVAVWLGGIWFAALAALACGVMLWELARMLSPTQTHLALTLAALGGGAVLLGRVLPGSLGYVGVAGPAMVGAALLMREKAVFAVYGVAITVAACGLVDFRVTHGAVWLVWLVLVVIATDVFGYFAGRMFGGPKFWPRISPKKTWAGTVAGWVAAGVIGVLFLTFTNAGRDLPWISMLLSLASQMGDIAESAIKRRAGVKDSSSLLPGHGGLLDRFDGLLGASLFMLLVAQLVYVPEVRF